MRTTHRRVVPVVLATVLGAASGPVAAQTPAVASVASVLNTVVATAAGTVGASAAGAEPVVFSGQASISGKVVYDTVFNAPPVLEIIVDLSGITGKGQRTGRIYQVATQAILHRPLVAFDSIELGISFAADSDVALARSALASFSVQYNAATGLKATPVRIASVPPA
ncbi:hypothetical protein GCM10028796_10570 [Ramlibacter monticola]|uniref:Uncharacterized protein n=1 Tax=Ramlibacter monticola TaxID=1926872 RepID=A0A937CPN7_9BURK|nr:hypothetical protein [Ramlibacter monticola]MBL0389910.1 hypothetical protein [Ramlibacter monticola]